MEDGRKDLRVNPAVVRVRGGTGTGWYGYGVARVRGGTGTGCHGYGVVRVRGGTGTLPLET